MGRVNKNAGFGITEAAREARRQYQRDWRKNNPEKVAAIQARYWEKKAKEEKPADEQGTV